MGKRTIYERDNSYFQCNISIRIYGQPPDKSNGATNDGRFGRILICSIPKTVVKCSDLQTSLVQATPNWNHAIFIYEIKRPNTANTMARSRFSTYYYTGSRLQRAPGHNEQMSLHQNN